MRIVNRTSVLSAALINAESNAYQWVFKTVAVDTEKNGNLCYGVTMMNKETTMKTSNYPFTQAFAIETLERNYNAKYNGTKTVRDMCTSLTDAISWEGESPDKVYHHFITKCDQPNRLVSDDQLFQVANSYVWGF